MKSKSYTLSIKDLGKRIDQEHKVLKKNQKTIEKNNKEIQKILESANELNVESIIKWIDEIVEWEQKSLMCRTIKSYAQFHNGRISGMNLIKDLLTTIKKNYEQRN